MEKRGYVHCRHKVPFTTLLYRPHGTINPTLVRQSPTRVEVINRDLYEATTHGLIRGFAESWKKTMGPKCII